MAGVADLELHEPGPEGEQTGQRAGSSRVGRPALAVGGGGGQADAQSGSPGLWRGRGSGLDTELLSSGAL